MMTAHRHGAAPGRDVARDHRDLAVNTNPMNTNASSAGSRNTKAITGHAGKRQDLVGPLAPRTTDIRSLLARLSATVSDQQFSFAESASPCLVVARQ
jgi:hypothetical protein